MGIIITSTATSTATSTVQTNNSKNVLLKQRAKSCEFAYLRLLNLENMATKALESNDYETLANFKADGLPLGFYLPANNNN
jgi:hypothetical protein